MSSPLLIDEPPLQVLPSLAVAIGLNEALILQQVHYWIGLKKRFPDKNKDTFVHGQWWVYNSVPQWNEQFPFWGDNTIRRALASLRDSGLLIAEQLNTGDPRDKTLWYRIDYAKLDTITAVHHKPKGSSKKKWVDASTQNGQSIDPIRVDTSTHTGQMQATISGKSLTETSSEITKRIHQRVAATAAPESSLTLPEPEKKEPEKKPPRSLSDLRPAEWEALEQEARDNLIGVSKNVVLMRLTEGKSKSLVRQEAQRMLDVGWTMAAAKESAK